jgi:hypothetical protein
MSADPTGNAQGGATGGGSGWGAFAAAVVDAGSAVYQNNENKKYQEREHDFSDDQLQRQLDHNSEMARYAFNQDLYMWNAANDYNLPENQMARLKAAGLNPNLVYGKGTSTLGSSNLPKYQAPTADFSRVKSPNVLPQVQSSVNSVINTYMDARMKAAQIDALNTQTMLAAANEKMVSLKSEGETYRNSIAHMNAKEKFDWVNNSKTGNYSLQSNQIRLDQMIKNLELTNANIQKAKLEAAYKRKEISWYEFQNGLKLLSNGVGLSKNVGITNKYRK